MKKWVIVAGVAAIAVAIAVYLVATRSDAPDAAATDAVVEDFRSIEREAIAAYNTALRRQRANEIDELELAVTIEREVLEPWRAMRSRVLSAAVPEQRRELYTVMHRYIERRLLAWQAYADALRAPSDAEARPLYDAYHEQNASAQRDAQTLGGMLRKL